MTLVEPSPSRHPAEPASDFGGETDPAHALGRYMSAIATTLGIPPAACWWELADHAEAYLALAERAPGWPDRDLALCWDEDHGWSIAIETRCGEDLLVLTYLAGDLLPTPTVVQDFLHALLAGEHPGQPHPPQLQHPDMPSTLTLRLRDYGNTP